MLKLKERLLSLWQKVLPFFAKTADACRTGAKLIAGYALKAGRFLGAHRIPTTVVCCCLVMTMLMSVITVTIHKVEVYDNGELVYTYHTADPAESSILEKSGLIIGLGDVIDLTEEKGTVTLSVTRAFPVSVRADGQTVLIMMTEGTVAKALTKAGLACGQRDRLNYETTAEVFSGMLITLDRVTGDQVVETVSIDYDTKKVETDELYVGETKVSQKGEKGEKKNTYEVTYVNGEETDRELISSEVTKEPVEKIVLVGTKVKSAFLASSTAPKNYKKVISMTATAYSAGGYTASGLPAQWGVVAVDPKVIPLGTRVYVETPDGRYIYGEAVAADTGGAIKGYKIDICVNTRKEAYAFGRRAVNVYILD